MSHPDPLFDPDNSYPDDWDYYEFLIENYENISSD